MDITQEVELIKAKTALAPYRKMPEHKTAMRSILRIAHNGGDVATAAFRAAVWFSMEESSQGYEWAAKRRKRGDDVMKVKNRGR